MDFAVSLGAGDLAPPESRRRPFDFGPEFGYACGVDTLKEWDARDAEEVEKQVATRATAVDHRLALRSAPSASRWRPMRCSSCPR
jgi:hypothetical protein